MPHCFLCYRRDDTAGHTERLYADLVRALGKSAVFMDTHSIRKGEDHRRATDAAIEAAPVVLVIIGKKWAPERLARTGDYVRREIETALRSEKHIIPVLVEGVNDMPDPGELPESIRNFVFKNAAKVSDRHWSRDVDALVHSIGDAQAFLPRRLGDVIPVARSVVRSAMYRGLRRVHRLATAARASLVERGGEAAAALPEESEPEVGGPVVAEYTVPLPSMITVTVENAAGVDRFVWHLFGGDREMQFARSVRQRTCKFTLVDRVTILVLRATTAVKTSIELALEMGGPPTKRYTVEVPDGTSQWQWVFRKP